MNDWQDTVECPKCESKDTRLVEFRDEISLYECNQCGCRFETEQ